MSNIYLIKHFNEQVIQNDCVNLSEYILNETYFDNAKFEQERIYITSGAEGEVYSFLSAGQKYIMKCFFSSLNCKAEYEILIKLNDFDYCPNAYMLIGDYMIVKKFIDGYHFSSRSKVLEHIDQLYNIFEMLFLRGIDWADPNEKNWMLGKNGCYYVLDGLYKLEIEYFLSKEQFKKWI